MGRRADIVRPLAGEHKMLITVFIGLTLAAFYSIWRVIKELEDDLVN